MCNEFFFNYIWNIINYEGQIMSKTFLCKFMLCSEGIQFIFYSGVVDHIVGTFDIRQSTFNKTKFQLSNVLV